MALIGRYMKGVPARLRCATIEPRSSALGYGTGQAAVVRVATKGLTQFLRLDGVTNLGQNVGVNSDKVRHDASG